jgi:hypothetical protein
MPDTIQVGIVGARFAARFHWEGYRRVYGVPVKVAGVTSKSAESREAFARDRGVPAFASLEALCDAADVIDICAPGSAHEPLAVAALQRGKHVVIEKPFTGYFGPSGAAGDAFRGNQFPKETMLREALASCDRILAAARESGKKICYAENWVYAPAIKRSGKFWSRPAARFFGWWATNPTAGRTRPTTASGNFPAAGRWWAKVAIR